MRHFPLLVAVLIAVILSPAPGLAQSRRLDTNAGGGGADLPTTPGHHKMFFSTTVQARFREQDGKIRQDQIKLEFAYLLYLPKDYDPAKSSCPMIVFLHGAGEGGTDLGAIFAHGPSAELERAKALQESFPFIVVSPQCGPGQRWDSPGMKEAVVSLLDDVQKNYRVDKTRIYLTGLSMGGKGTWLIGMQAPEKFAAIVPISAVDVEIQQAAARLRGVSVWIIVGADDGGFTEGSRTMAATLKSKGIDAQATAVPNSGHDTWGRYYPKPRFYNYLLFHRKGMPPDRQRYSGEELVKISTDPGFNREFLQRITDEFHKFLPWWGILNCGDANDPGLKDELAGKKNVFVTNPLSADTPCMLQITAEAPAGKKTFLNLTVGHHPEGQWILQVRVDNRIIKTMPINKTTTKDGWVDVDVDLTAWAGKSPRIELFNRANEQAGKTQHPEAYWAKVEVTQK